jgi:hypothetical protein
MDDAHKNGERLLYETCVAGQPAAIVTCSSDTPPPREPPMSPLSSSVCPRRYSALLRSAVFEGNVSLAAESHFGERVESLAPLYPFFVTPVRTSPPLSSLRSFCQGEV